MDLDQSVRAIEEQLKQAKERVERVRNEIDSELRTSTWLIRIHSEKARNVANEALAEIRHLTQQLDNLTSAANTTLSPETHRATAHSRRRGGRG